jgi:hypothetical protein
MSWAGPDSDLPMTLNLQSNKLDLNELSSLFPESTESEHAEKLQWAELFTQSEWLEKWFELPPVDIDLAANQVDGFQLDFADAALHASLRDRQIKDGRLNLRLEDIAIEGAIEANLQERPWTVAFDSVFSNIDVGGVLV